MVPCLGTERVVKALADKVDTYSLDHAVEGALAAVQHVSRRTSRDAVASAL